MTIDAESIAGRRVVLPADSNGAPFVAIFGFSRRAGEATAQWGDALAKALPPDRAIYAVADLSRIPGIIRGFVIAGIRKAASPTPPDDRNRVLLLTRRNEWSRIVPGGSDDDAVIVAVDASGSISYIERRPFSAHAAKDVAEAIASRP